MATFRSTRRRRQLAAALLVCSTLAFSSLFDDSHCSTGLSRVQSPGFRFGVESSSPWTLTVPWMALLGRTVFGRLLKGPKGKRRFWTAERELGVWDGEFCRSFRLMDERGFRDLTDDQYKIHFRMDRGAFWRLHDKYGQALERMNTQLRLSIPSDKRLAVTLHWLAHGLSFQQLALLYAVGKSTAVEIVHSTIAVLKRDLVPDSIRFPEGHELQQVITDFQHLAGLPQCAGAVDGTFMKIDKPLHHGDSYWCYKKYCA